MRDPRIFDTHAQATEALVSHYPCRSVSCDEWHDADVDLYRSSPVVRTSSRSGAYLLEHLGYVTPEQQASGQCDAPDFLGRVLTALALTPAEASHRAAATVPDDTEAPIGHDPSARPGYLHDRLHELHALAEWCVLHGNLVCWS